ncbi:MAG: transketolase C-terminal domain-containing protein, partial [Bacteroidales bacterium]
VIKGLLLRGSNLFQSMGFRYFGPADGHDVVRLVKILYDLKKIQGPKLLHIITVKGKGLRLAEQDQTTYHAPGKFDPDTGELIRPTLTNQPPRFQDVFGETILELARQDPKIVGITPAMLTGCSLTIMDEVYPERVFDVGIAEQHAVTFSAGLAVDGYIPFCNIYSSFLQRAYDQIVHDVALQKLSVIFCIDRGGIVGEDGSTHQGLFDLAFLRTIPHMIISAPINEHELRNLMYTAYLNSKAGGLPFAIRYPRGTGVLMNWKNEPVQLQIGKGRVLREGQQMAIISIGAIGNRVTEAIDLLKEYNVHPAQVDICFLKPIDRDLLQEIASTYPIIITVENGTDQGGLFSAVAEFFSEKQLTNKLYHIATHDQFITHGDIPNLYKEVGFDAEGIVKTVLRILEK